jgi:hypothetical protein
LATITGATANATLGALSRHRHAAATPSNRNGSRAPSARLWLAWAAIGFAGLLIYPHLLQNLSFVEEDAGISLVATFHWLGIGHSVARTASCAGAGLLLLAAWRVRSCRYGAQRSLGFAILAALTASPIVWTQYLTLLLIPIALLSPSLSPMWLVLVIPWPFIPWMTTHMEAHLLATAPFLAVEIAVLLRLVVPDSRSLKTVAVSAVGGSRRLLDLVTRRPATVARPVRLVPPKARRQTVEIGASALQRTDS